MKPAGVILLLTDSDAFAGTERHMIELARGLKAQGAGVRIACPEGTPLATRARAESLDILALARGGALDIPAILKLRSWLLNHEVDLIHAHNGRTALLAALAIRSAGRGSLVTTQHFLSPSRDSRRGLRGWLSRQAHGWLSRQVSHQIAISEAARTEMLRRKDAPAERITVIPNGISPLPPASRETAASVRAEFSIPASAPLIVCLARLVPEKDVPVLIDAMAEVAQAVPGVRCLVAGEGTLESAINAQIRQLGLSETVLLAGFREDALSLLSAADLFVLPSRAEPFGLVLLEAMALGKAVVATRAGGPLEIVADGITGLLAEPGNSPSLAQALAALLQDSACRSAMGDAGLARFHEKFTARRMATETLAVFSHVLAKNTADQTRTDRTNATVPITTLVP